MKNLKKKHRITYSAYFFVQILCVLLALFDITVTCVSTYEILDENVENQLELTEGKIAEYMNNVWSLADSIANNHEMWEPDDSLDENVKKLVSFSEQYGLYSIGIAKANGEFADTNGGGIINISGEPQFQEVKSEQQDMLTDIYQAAQQGNPEVFTIWKSAFDEKTKEWSGAVEITVFADYMQEIVEGDSLDGKYYFCMYDSELNASAHADIAAKGQSLEENYQSNIWVSREQEKIKSALIRQQEISYWKIYKGKIQYCKVIPVENTNWNLSIRTDVVKCYRAPLLALLSKVLVYLVAAILFWWKGSREERRLQSTFSWMTDTVDEVFILQNADTNEMEYISNNAERIMGYSPEEIRSQQEFINEWLMENNIDIEELSRSQDYQFQRKIANPHTGEEREFDIHIYVRNGKIGNYQIVVITDKTRELKQKEALETSLIQVKNASKAKSRFLSNMSHDIRTPMNAIVGMTTIAKMNLDNPRRLEDCIHKIELSSMHLKSLINDVLDMSRIESGRVMLNEEVFNLVAMLHEVEAVIQVQAEAKKQEWTVDLSNIIHETVVSDKLRIQQILTNVLGNAVKFTPEGGQIKLSVEEKESQNKEVRYYEFYCMDNGIGMSKETQEKVFVPFERGEAKKTGRIEGTGLGMAITKNIVTMMNGTIDIISSPGAGSTFIIRIPMQNEKNTADLETEEISGPTEPVCFKEGAVRILLVEDNELNMEIAKELLGITGAEIEMAWDGKEGLEQFAEHPADYYDIILSDVQMPEMNGYEMTQAIRSMNRDDAKKIPIVAMTANAFSSDVIKARQAGMTAHIAKPIELKDLYGVLHRWVSGEKQEEGSEAYGVQRG
ncbi:MAG: response regulator [Lachnospiraceae bacterium]|nr:response regulator [Lachnospiraceae bacterium]